VKRLVVAPDSFKESLDANQAAEAIAAGFLRVFPRLDIVRVPMSDGGEGLVRTLVSATGGKLLSCNVTGPLGKQVPAFFGRLGDGETCVVEMAAASGLPLVPPSERNPMVTTTYGTGELIRYALDTGCRHIIVGIGGSATNDGGAGMAQALGAGLLDSGGKEIGVGALSLKDLARIDTSCLDRRLAGVKITVASDVTNPLCGPQGASHVYGPQKGATPEMVMVLDGLLRRYAGIIRRDLGVDVTEMPGAGAAGGLGAALVAVLGAVLRPGVEVVLEVVGLEQILRQGADLVVTGEGQINRQTAFGKVPVGVAALAKKFDLPVIALVGSVGEGAEAVLELGIDAYFSLIRKPMTLEECLADAAGLLAAAAEQCARLVRALSVDTNV
jgi:glycerate kinase